MRDTSFIFYAATLGFFFGIALASSFNATYYDALLGMSIASASAVFFYLRREMSYVCFGVAILFASLGMMRFEFAEHRAPHTLDVYENTKVMLEGVVKLEPDKRERNTHLIVAVEKIGEVETTGTILVYDDRVSQVRYGDRVKIEGALKKPEVFETEFGRTFEYPGYLKAQGVSHTMSFVRVEILSRENGLSGMSALFEVKSRISTAISTVLLPPESGLALGLLLGEKQALGKDLLSSFRNAGLIHIVVLSGYNISILIIALLWMLSSFSLRVRSVVGGIVIVLFVLMVGPSATVLRAALMALLVLLARTTGRIYAILRALTASGCIILLWNPYLLAYDPGFQLSFLATLGLILVAPHIEQLFVRIPDTLGLKGFAISTLATQIMVLPILSYSVGSFSVVALLANMLVLPLVASAMLVAGLAGLSHIFLPSLGILVGYPAYLVLSYIISVGQWLGTLPFSAITLPQFSFMWVVVAYMGIVLGLWYLSLQKNPHPKVVVQHRDEDIFRF